MNGTWKCKVKMAVCTPGTKKLRKIRKPAAMVAMDEGLPTKLFIHPNRKPHTGPKPRLR